MTNTFNLPQIDTTSRQLLVQWGYGCICRLLHKFLYQAQIFFDSHWVLMNKVKSVVWLAKIIWYLFSETYECYFLALIYASQQSHLLASFMILWNHLLLFWINATSIVHGVYFYLDHSCFNPFSSTDFSYCTFSLPFHLRFDLSIEPFYLD